MIASFATPETLQIDAAIIATYQDQVAGRIGETEVARRVALFEAQRNSTMRSVGVLSVLRPIGSTISKFLPRRRPRSPDREASRRRRRMLARGGHMPPDVRCSYTEGEASALTIIAREVKHHGVCDLPIDQIAAEAGVCRTTVQNAMREAQRRAHITVEHRPVKGRKSKTNIVRIVSREWLAWIKRGPAIGFKTPKPVNPTRNLRFKNRNRGPLPVERQHGCRLECG